MRAWSDVLGPVVILTLTMVLKIFTLSQIVR